MNPNESEKNTAAKNRDDDRDGNILTGAVHETALDGNALNNPEHLDAFNGMPSHPETEAEENLAKPKKKLPTPFDMPDPRNGPTPRR